MHTRFTCRNLFLNPLFLFLFICVLPPSEVLGQGKFLDGYIISLAGDTLNGFIKYRDLDKNPVVVDYSVNKNGSLSQKLNHEKVREFYISELQLRYKSRTIGIIDIKLDDEYSSLPSIQAKDSLIVYLKEVTAGPKATLFVLSKDSGKPHYFLEKDKILTELINYPYYRTVNGAKYLAVYDEYKNQLPILTSESEVSKRPVPSYNLKSLINYVDDYNASFGGQKDRLVTNSGSRLLIDLNINAGLAGSQKDGPNQSNKMIFGVGVRVNLPNQFHNRYVRLNLLFMPGVSYLYKDKERSSFKAIQAEIGTHFGSKKIRPFVGLGTNIPVNYLKSGTLGPHLGISYLRQFNIEISNFANLYSFVSQKSVFNKPTVSLNYYLNLNTFFNKK